MSAQASTALFENFEPGNGETNDPLDGQNDWSVDSGSGDVQTAIVQSGTQALEMASGSVSKGTSTMVRFGCISKRGFRKHLKLNWWLTQWTPWQSSM